MIEDADYPLGPEGDRDMPRPSVLLKQNKLVMRDTNIIGVITYLCPSDDLGVIYISGSCPSSPG